MNCEERDEKNSGPIGGSEGVSEKIMSMTLAEFRRGVERLAPNALLDRDARLARIPISSGEVCISATQLDTVTLGGLMQLPRCRVQFHFSDVNTEDRTAFIAQFDRVFQRGGG